MPTEWTPRTGDVKRWYSNARYEAGHDGTIGEFDRWLAAHDAEVRAPWEAEVERLRAVQQAITECRDDPAAAIVRADRIAGEHIIRAVTAEARAEAAEAKVRAGLALADEYAASSVRVQPWVIADRLRAALADPTREPIWLGPGVDSLQADPPERP